MFSERGAMALAYGLMALAVLVQGYMIYLVSIQVANSQASLDRITALVNHVIQLH